MYEDFFGLEYAPFSNTPDPRFFLTTPDHEEALASLIYAVEERKGFVLLTGDIGAGKTLISRLMLRHFGDAIRSCVIHHPLADSDELFEAISSEFGLTFRSGDRVNVLLRGLQEFLLAQYANDVPVVIVVDEAQQLPPDAFEQLRMLGNLEAEQAKLLQIVFAGQPELGAVFQRPEMSALRQRLFRTFHLKPLSEDVARSYIEHRLRVAGATEPIFDPEAIARVFELSRGVPRVINTICDNAMLAAYSEGKSKVGAEMVEAVAPSIEAIPGARWDRPVDAGGRTRGRRSLELVRPRETEPRVLKQKEVDRLRMVAALEAATADLRFAARDAEAFSA